METQELGKNGIRAGSRLDLLWYIQGAEPFIVTGSNNWILQGSWIFHWSIMWRLSVGGGPLHFLLVY